MNENCCKKKIKVINIGLQRFYDALVDQKVEAVQIQWKPPFKQKEEIVELLEDLL